MITRISFIAGEGIDNQTEAQRREVFNKMVDHLRGNPNASITELFEAVGIPNDCGGSELEPINDYTDRHTIYPPAMEIIETQDTFFTVGLQAINTGNFAQDMQLIQAALGLTTGTDISACINTYAATLPADCEEYSYLWNDGNAPMQAEEFIYLWEAGNIRPEIKRAFILSYISCEQKQN